MRKYLLLLWVLGLTIQSFAQDKKAEQKNGGVITWEKKTHDFGTLIQGDKAEHTFYFTNTGNEPLIITNVQIDCGCTKAKGWPRDPIPPRGSGEITVSFDTVGKTGIQNKTVTLVTNAVNPEGNTITFTTSVMEKKL
jgi:hypothetical protein